MPIPSTGPISFSVIQGEFGGSNPISLSEYYRGALVPNTGTNAAVPTSGVFAVSALRGAAAYVPDYIPNAIDLGDLIASNSGVTIANTNQITITGISEPITLLFNFVNGEVNHSSGGGGATTSSLSVLVNGSAANSVSWSQTGTGQTFNIVRAMHVTVNNNDTIRVDGIVDGAAGAAEFGVGGASANVRIYNTSSSNTFLDSFQYTFSVTFEASGGA